MDQKARINTVFAAVTTMYLQALELELEEDNYKRQDYIRQIGDLCLRTGESCRQHLMDWPKE